MFFKCLATEQQDSIEGQERVRILSYAPGPLDTDMQTQIRLCMPDVGLRRVFEEMHSSNQLIDPMTSALKLVGLLERDEFKNGSHLDYYDV